MGKAGKVQSNLEMAQYVSMMAVALDSGLTIAGALESVFTKATGSFATRIVKLLRALDLGANLYDELEALSSRTRHPSEVEFTMKLMVAIEFGSPLVEQFEVFAHSLSRAFEQELITVATKKENTMLLPLVFLILPITIVFALFPSLEYLQLG
jgi:tight adherence protein C